MRSLTLLLLLSRLVSAAGGPTGNQGKDSFVLAPTVENERAYVLLTSAARYSFILPNGWYVRYSAEDREISLTSGNGGNIQMLFRDQEKSRGIPGSKQWMAALEEKYPGAKKVDDLQLSALSQRVTGFDLEWLRGAAPQSGRFARVPLDQGYLEFSLISPRDSFGSNLSVLMQLMLSLRMGPAGEAVPLRRSSPE